MVRVTAATSFLGNEGMWRAGETREVSAHRAHELIEQGYVIESREQKTGTPLEQAAAAIGAKVGTSEPQTASLTSAAEALGAKVVTTESIKGKAKKKPGQDREIKPDSTQPETK